MQRNNKTKQKMNKNKKQMITLCKYASLIKQNNI